MLEKGNVKIGKAYCYIFDKQFPNDFCKTLMYDCEKRFRELGDIVELSFSEWKRPFYVFELAEDNEAVSGKTYDRLIKCRIHIGYEGEMPMVHEEAHMIAFQKMGQMPYAWSEGFAEYIVAKYLGGIEQLGGKYGNYTDLDYSSGIEVILYCLTHDDQKLFDYLRKNNILYAMSLASIIFFIESEMGKHQLAQVQSLITKGLFEELNVLLTEKVIYQWVSWVKNLKHTKTQR
ncbi:hypothetical protein IMSAGC003_03429 [Lachnospiraceae bacterium]|nr:hypothetical protein IMSAGC003_03429 [Lachnospiraceae bacterium]